MMHLDYVILYVRDVDVSVEFYRDIIGLRHRFTRDGYAEFGTGEARFGLLAEQRAKDLIREKPAGGGGGEVLFLVDDLDQEAGRLRREGIEFLSGPADRGWGHRTLHLRDPDGHVIELAQEIARQ